MQNQEQIPFIHILRAMAPLPVMWAHLALMAEWQYHGTWLPLTLFDRMVAGPLHLYQSGGHLGVMVFFLISGYIISFVAEREERMPFAVKRVFRLLPALVAAIIILSILNTIGSISRPHIKVTDYLLSMFLLDQFFWPSATVLQVTWTLFPEVVFYAIVCLFMPLIKSRPVAATFALAVACCGVAVATNAFGHAPSHTSHLGYLPMFIIGRVFFLLQGGKMRTDVAIVFVAGSLLMMYGMFDAIWPDQMWNDPRKAWTYPLAILIFYGCMLWNPRTMPRAVSFLADISYSLYLIHVPVGWFVMDKVQPLAGFTAGFVAAVASSIFAAWLIYTRIEVPGRVFGRKLIANISSKRAAHA